MVAAARVRRSGSGDVTLAFSGGDGSSVERAVVINVASEGASVNFEFDWLERHAPGCRVQSRHTFKVAQKHYDNADVTCADGTKRTYIFDISASY
jgi:hypothetical protein